MYTSLSIENFRGIHTLEMKDFRRVNILTGKNNCGKTSVLEAMYMLSQSENPQAAGHFASYRRFEVFDDHYWWSFFYNFGTSAKIKGAIQGALAKTLTLKPFRADDAQIKLIVPDELKGKVKSLEIEPAFLLGIKLAYEVSPLLENLYSSFSVSRKLENAKELQVDWAGPRTLIASIPATLFIHPAYFEDATDRFSDLELQKGVNQVVTVLRSIEPTIQYIRLLFKTFYCDVGKDRLMPLNVMGDGMVRLFSIILAIATTPGGVVLIDEIDTGFHYSSLEVMWKAVYAAAEQFDVQIFATTHSYECLRALGGFIEQRGEEDDNICLYRLDKRQNEHDAVRFDQQQLKVSLEHFWEVR